MLRPLYAAVSSLTENANCAELHNKRKYTHKKPSTDDFVC